VPDGRRDALPRAPLGAAQEIAIENDVELIECDADFRAFAALGGLKLFSARRR